MVNKITKKSKSKKQSKRKLKNNLYKKQGGNLNEYLELNDYLEDEKQNPSIIYTRKITDFIEISRDNFKKLLLINSFYEMFSEVENIPIIKTPSTRLKYDPNKRPKIEPRILGGNISNFDYKLLACLDNIHDFAGNNRCSVKYEGDENKSFKNYILDLYEILGLSKKEISEYNLKEGLILYKILEKYSIDDKMIFKMNKNFIQKKSNKRGRNNSNNNNNINSNDEYIIQDVVIPHLKTHQCVLYDSPVSKLNESHLLNKKNNISTIIAIKNNKEIYETPPEKLFDSGTSYNKGTCKLNEKQKSINYNVYPLFQLGGKSIEFCKCINKLSYKDKCSLYNLSNGYSLRQLKEWIIHNIVYFKDFKVNNSLVNKSHLNNNVLKNFIDEICNKLNGTNNNTNVWYGSTIYRCRIFSTETINYCR